MQFVDLHCKNLNQNVKVQLIFFKVIKYPNEKWKFKMDKLRNSKYGWLLKIGLVIIIISLFIDIII